MFDQSLFTDTLLKVKYKNFLYCYLKNWPTTHRLEFVLERLEPDLLDQRSVHAGWVHRAHLGIGQADYLLETWWDCSCVFIVESTMNMIIHWSLWLSPGLEDHPMIILMRKTFLKTLASEGGGGLSRRALSCCCSSLSGATIENYFPHTHFSSKIPSSLQSNQDSNHW